MVTRSERSRMAATEGGHRVTPAELFFDLVFVYAITQVTALMAADPTAQRLLGAGVVLALLWWCWCCFAWLGNVVRADSGPMFGVLIAVMAVVLVVSLTVPEVYTDAPGGLDTPLVFVLCYGAVRILHLVTYWLSDREDQALHATLRRTALLSVAPPFVLLLVGSAFTGITQILIWLGAVLIDYLGIYITGSSGWRVASPGHFSERHGLIVIIALGESIVAIGVGVSGLPLNAPVLLAAPAGLLVVAGLWRLYFRRLSEPAEHRLAALEGDDRTRFARDVYTFLHLPLVAGCRPHRPRHEESPPTGRRHRPLRPVGAAPRRRRLGTHRRRRHLRPGRRGNPAPDHRASVPGPRRRMGSPSCARARPSRSSLPCSPSPCWPP